MAGEASDGICAALSCSSCGDGTEVVRDDLQME